MRLGRRLMLVVLMASACSTAETPSVTSTPPTSAAPATTSTIPPVSTTRLPTREATTSTTTAEVTTTTRAPVSSLTWWRIPDDGDAPEFGGDGFQTMFAVASTGSGLVAVGADRSGGDADAAIWNSPDGITWSRVPHDEAALGGESDQFVNDVTVGGPGLVAVGHEGPLFADTDAAVWTSPDGITWSRAPHDEAVFGGENDQSMTSITAGGPGLVAVGRDSSGDDSDAAVWTSADGITWSRVPHGEAVFGGENDQGMNSVTAGGLGLGGSRRRRIRRRRGRRCLDLPEWDHLVQGPPRRSGVRRRQPPVHERRPRRGAGPGGSWT